MALRRGFRFCVWLGLSTTIFAGTAVAQSVDGAGILSSGKPEISVPKSAPRIGVMLGAGVPDGATASAVYRPLSWLRTEAGGSYNMVSKGVRGGASLVPFGVGPSVSLEAGHTFDGNANGLARTFAGSSFSDKAALQRIGYDYANLQLGLELGGRRVVFFIHGGMSYVRATVHNLNADISSSTSSGAAGSSGGTTVSFNQDPVVRVLTPSAKLGLIFYIW